MSKDILWIDDNPARESTADAIGAVFLNAHRDAGNLEDELKEIFHGDSPRLIILDHFLNDAAGDTVLFQRGSTIAEAAKERWPGCPVVGITGGPIESIVDRTKAAYDEFLDFTSFGDHLELIDVLAQGFQTVRELPNSDTKQLADLLKPPEIDREQLIDSFPEILKGTKTGLGTASEFYSWFRHLAERPGFLYDELWTATILGLNLTGFSKVASKFVRAKYAGIFLQDGISLWWRSSLAENLFELAAPDAGEFTWHVGRRIPGLDEADFSQCHNCGEEFPETVAYLDAQSTERQPMHLRCTVLHPGFNRELYFEDIRIMDEG